jgi:hypothetical protein
VQALDAEKAKVQDYGKFLGRDFSAVTKRIDALRVKVAAVTTRGSLLEVD